MNVKKYFFQDTGHKRIKYTESNAATTLSQIITSWLPREQRDYVILCIGTDRSTGDALGPLTGTFLKDRPLRRLSVYGTVHEPVHAKNLDAFIRYIHDTHNNPYIIAIDASLGKTTSVGYLTVEKGPVKPGAALNKPLPEIGEMHLTGIVNVSGYMEYTVLQSTRLSIVFDMAQTLANVLDQVDRHILFNEFVRKDRYQSFETNKNRDLLI